MIRGRFVLRDGELVAKHLAPPLRRPARSDLARPFVISDACEFRSMANGEMYTSKSAYRADLRAAGREEIGNDTEYLFAPEPEPDMGNVEQDIATVYEQLEAR